MDFFNTSKPDTPPTLLAQGSYGCVYYPGFTCTGRKQTKKTVSKIQENTETLENELEIASRIIKIKNYPTYFAPIINNCPISIDKLTKYYPEPIRQCKAITQTPQSQTQQTTGGKGTPQMSDTPTPPQKENFSINEIRYILGEDLNKSFESKKLTYHANQKGTYLFLINTYDYLQNSLKKLKSKNICHYDLKANNIIYDTESQIPIIIDFGLSIPLDKINPTAPEPKIIRHYFFDTYEYDFWCLEPIFIGIYASTFLKYKYTDNKEYNSQKISELLGPIYTTTIELYADFCDVFKPNFIAKLSQIFPPKQPSIKTQLQNFKQTFITKWTKYITDHKEDTNQNFFQQLWESRYTWDNYSLAIIYLEFISNLPPLQPGDPNITNITKFTEFLLNIVLSLPKEREINLSK